MGLNIRIYNIICPNPFELSYRIAPTPGDESVVSTGYTQYGGTYDSSDSRNYYDNPIILTGSTFDNIFSQTLWLKIKDTVTNGYIIENIKIHSESYYDDCFPVCDFSGGTASLVVSTATPTETPTTTSTTLDCVFSGGTAELTTIIPTTTPTITETPTTTPTTTTTVTPTVTTSNTVQLDWAITVNAGGGLEIRDKDDNVLLNETVSLTGTQKSGTLNIDNSICPYSIKGYWFAGSGNVVEYLVCDISNTSQLYASSPLGPSELITEETYIVNPTPLHVAVTLWKNGQIAPTCPV